MPMEVVNQMKILIPNAHVNAPTIDPESESNLPKTVYLIDFRSVQPNLLMRNTIGKNTAPKNLEY